MNLHLSTFRFDVTPPMGHPLCGGWIKPVVGVDDPLEAIGIVIMGAGTPIVLCAVDWCSICNDANLAWRQALAEAAHTTPERVAVHTVHQHNAPFVCLEANEIAGKYEGVAASVDIEFFRRCLAAGKKAVSESLGQTHRLTHIATGQGKVEKVASNRRFVGPDGTINAWRGSSAPDPKLRELPEGLIDPWLKTVAFYSGDKKLAALHYYATHPMSYYGDGMVSSDFVGLARKRRQADEPEVCHIYFTGCSGNVAAGKYNDGSKEARRLLTDRVYAGIVASERSLVPKPIRTALWQTDELLPAPRDFLIPEKLKEQIANKDNAMANRCRPTFMLAYHDRLAAKKPIVVSSLHIDDVALLHLPAESFLEYQLRAQELGRGRFVATAAYGDGGTWYIPVAECYPQGGYEVSVAFSAPSIDPRMTSSIQRVLARGG